MEGLPVLKDHYVESRRARLQIGKLEILGWFKRRIEMTFGEIKQIVQFLDTSDPEEDAKKGIFFPGSLPALDVFKLAMLNKEFKKAIESCFEPLKLNDFKKYYDTIKFSEMMAREPDFSQYENSEQM